VRGKRKGCGDAYIGGAVYGGGEVKKCGVLGSKL
jgi:hypothetical protein